MRDQPAAKRLRLSHQPTYADSDVSGGDQRRLDELADLEIDLQNAARCIRLRGEEDAIQVDPPLRRAA